MFQSHIFTLRSRYLLGSALAACVMAGAVPASAQSVAPALLANGNIVSSSDQTQAGVSITSSANDPNADVIGDVNLATINLSANALRALASANTAASNLQTEPGETAGTISTTLASGAPGTLGTANVLAATRQTATDTLVWSRETAIPPHVKLGVIAGSVTSSKITVSDGIEEALAVGNEAGSAITLESANLFGAGIVTDQQVSGSSVVRSERLGETRIGARSLTGSDLAITGSVQRAAAYANTSANDLDAVAGTAHPEPGNAPSRNTGAGSGAEVNATYAVLSDQRIAASVGAKSYGGYNLEVSENSEGSALTIGSNRNLSVAGGNRSANGLELSLTGLAATPYAQGAIANVTNVQSSTGLVDALTDGAPRVSVVGTAKNVAIAVRGNTMLASATANLAEGNTLTVTGGDLVPSILLPGGGGNPGGWPPLPPVGTALADAEGAMSVTAPFSIQNSQLSATNVTAQTHGALVDIAAAGHLTGSRLEGTNNLIVAGATGNEGVNGLKLEGTTIATPADVNSLQRGSGTVFAGTDSAIGAPGVSLLAAAGASETAFSVSGNAVAVDAAQNRVSNTLEADAAALNSSSGHSRSEAGVISGGTGAAADFALANGQHASGTTEDPGRITAFGEAKYVISSGGPIDRSSLEITGNSSSVSALGNGASNRVSLSGARIGVVGASAPGSALSNVQTGNVDAWASSHVVLAIPANATGSTAEVSQNANLATGSVNAAENVVAIEAASIGKLSGTAMFGVDAGMTGTVSGDHVLASQQLAGGIVVVDAVTETLLGGNGSQGNSSLTVAGNLTQASAKANDVLNTLSLASAAGTDASAGLLNNQQSSASTTARATGIFAGAGVSGPGSQARIGGNPILAEARGNTASNLLSLDAAPLNAPNGPMAQVTLNAASGQAVLGNRQANFGAVTASATSTSYLPAFYGQQASSAANGSGQRLEAAAYGNSAVNSAVPLNAGGLMPATLVSNAQVNSGSISTYVANNGIAAATMTTSSVRLNITGHAATAQAIGNSAVNTIGRSN